MMDPHELHYDLMELLRQFRRDLAHSGSGDLIVKPDTFPIAVKAHQHATDLLRVLESDEFENTVLP